MTIRFMDNFSLYHTGEADDLLNGLYASIQSQVVGNNIFITTDPDGVSTGQVCHVASSSSSGDWSILRYVLQTAGQTTVGAAFRVWLSALPADPNNFPTLLSWRDASNAQIASVCVDTTGRLYIATGGDDTSHTILTRSTLPVISANAWYHIECKRIAASNISVRVEGVTALNYNNAIGSGSDTYQISWENHGVSGEATPEMYIKDLVIWDGQGTANNDFLGKCIVYDCDPASDVSLNWTPTGGATGFGILATSPFDNTKHIDAPNPPPAAYVCSLTDLPASVTTVKAVMTVVRAAKSDGGDATLQVSVKSGASTATGSNRPITIAQTYWPDVQELDPATGVAWTPTGVNAAQMQINRTS